MGGVRHRISQGESATGNAPQAKIFWVPRPNFAKNAPNLLSRYYSCLNFFWDQCLKFIKNAFSLVNRGPLTRYQEKNKECYLPNKINLKCR